jgi:protein TonB
MAYAPESSLSGRRLTSIVIVVLLHVAVFVGLKAGLARHAIELITGPLDVQIIEEEIKPDQEPPPPPPKIEIPPPFVPPPEVNIVFHETPTAITTVSTVPPPPDTPSQRTETPVTTKPPGPTGRGLTKPEYPPVSRRLSQEGTVTLLLYILETGRVGDAKVQESSGFPKLDEAALNHAKRAWRFIPGREGDKPIAMWYPFRVVFRLED